MACHLFFIKTKTMKLRQLQQQAMQQAAVKRQQLTATTATHSGRQERRGEDDSALLNSHLQQLYRQGRLGDDPYIVHIPQPPPPPPPPRFTRPPQPVTAVIPALKIDPGPYEAEEQKESEPKRLLHSRISSSGRLVPLFDRDCVWHLYPHELSMAAELEKKEGEREAESSITGGAAEALVRSHKTIKAK